MARLRLILVLVVCMAATVTGVHTLLAIGDDTVSEHVVDYVRIGRVDLSGRSPMHAVVGQPIQIKLEVTPYFSNNDVPELYIRGADAWKPVLSATEVDHGNALGECVIREDAPFLLREQISKRLYIQVPREGTCTIRLRLAPKVEGTHTLSFQVYTRNIMNVDERHFVAPYAIDRRTKARGPELSWAIQVGG